MILLWIVLIAIVVLIVASIAYDNGVSDEVAIYDVEDDDAPVVLPDFSCLDGGRSTADHHTHSHGATSSLEYSDTPDAGGGCAGDGGH